MLDVIIKNLDFVWLPITWFVVHKHQRVKATGFVLACILTLRLQVELMESIDHASGILHLLESHVLYRGQMIYTVVFILYLTLACYSPKTDKIIFFAASLSIYFLTFCASMLIMLL